MAFVFYRPVIYCLCTWNESKFKTINHLLDVDTNTGTDIGETSPVLAPTEEGRGRLEFQLRLGQAQHLLRRGWWGPESKNPALFCFSVGGRADRGHEESLASIEA